jgi:haloacetate dehalogenase
LPETLLNNSIDFFMSWFRGETQTEYLRAAKNPATIHAMCEDYRAAASVDLEHDEADLGIKVACPLLAWPSEGQWGVFTTC